VVLGVRARAVGTLAVLGMLAAVAAGCGDDGSPEPAAEPRADARAGRADIQLVEAYVDAMGEGDVDAAMAMRCEDGRIERDERELFESDLGRFVDTHGRLGVARAGITDTDPVMADESLENPVEVTYWMTLDGEEAAEPLVGVVVDEGGERRLCSFTTSELAHMQAVLGDDLEDLGQPRAGTLSELMPTSPGPGHRQAFDEAIDPDTLTGSLDGAVDGWARAWQKLPYGGVTVSAMRFPSAEAALEAGRGWMARVDQAAVEIFEVPDLAGASGVRFLGYEWLWVQPPTEGPFIDEVSMVLGDVYVTVAVANLPTGSGHDMAVAQADEVARLSRRP
jgi:hypothetical protein